MLTLFYSEEKAGSQLKMFIEDGGAKRFLPVSIEAGKMTDLNLQLKQ